jgi:TPR repeat protein
VARARDILSATCARRHGEACTALGQVIVAQSPLNDPAIAQAWRSACELADGQGCELLGLLEARDPATRAAATAHLGLACAMGRLTSCHARARIEWTDPAQRGLAAQHLADNCQHGYAPSCTQLALSSAPLVSPQTDCARTLPLARRACAGHDDTGCTIADACELATRPQDAATLDRLRRRCSSRAPLACLYWAEAQTSLGVEAVDNQDVHDAYLRACRSEYFGPDNLACVRLATLDLAHAQTVAEAGYAIGLLRRACDQSLAEACCRLADSLAEGKFVAPDANEAARLRSKACELGHLGCCKTADPSPPGPGTPAGPRG